MSNYRSNTKTEAEVNFMTKSHEKSQQKCFVTLDLDAGFSAAPLRLELVAVSHAASEPELSAGVGCGVVVPLHHVVPAGSWIQGLTAALRWRQPQTASVKLKETLLEFA